MLLILHGSPGFACLPVSLTIIPSCISKNILQSWVCSPAKGIFWQNVKLSQNASEEKGPKTNQLSGLDLTKHEKKKKVTATLRTKDGSPCRTAGKVLTRRWKTGKSKEEPACRPWFVLCKGCRCLGISTCDRDTLSVISWLQKLWAGFDSLAINYCRRANWSHIMISQIICFIFPLTSPTGMINCCRG